MQKEISSCKRIKFTLLYMPCCAVNHYLMFLSIVLQIHFLYRQENAEPNEKWCVLLGLLKRSDRGNNVNSRRTCSLALVFDEGQFTTQVSLVKAWNKCCALIPENRSGLVHCLKNSIVVLIYMCKLKQVIA